jgi:hypothetical protein
MSSSDDIKGQADTSAREGSKLDSFDGVDTPDAEDNYHGHLGSTRHDNNDMERMGKVQELRVSKKVEPFQLNINKELAKLPSSLRLEFYHDSARHLGGDAGVSQVLVRVH